MYRSLVASGEAHVSRGTLHDCTLKCASCLCDANEKCIYLDSFRVFLRAKRSFYGAIRSV